MIQTFLSENFRDKSTTGRGAFGCSFTYGTGVEYDEAWPKLIGANNYGLPGSSNDKICRLAIEYISIAKPDAIFVMWTFENRREWIDEDGNVLRFKADDVRKLPGRSNRYKWEEAHFELYNKHWDHYNYSKNKLLLENFCVNTDVKLYQLYVSDIDHTLMNSYGSDKAHPGKEWHIHVSENFTKQMVAHT